MAASAAQNFARKNGPGVQIPPSLLKKHAEVDAFYKVCEKTFKTLSNEYASETYKVKSYDKFSSKTSEPGVILTLSQEAQETLRKVKLEKAKTVSYVPTLKKCSQEANYSYLSPCCKGVSKKQAKRNVLSLIDDVKNGKIKVNDLSDEQILDIWSWRLYDRPLDDNPEIRSQFIQKFNKLCEQHYITFNPGEVFVRTIPEKVSFDTETFSLGKFDESVGFWPAAAARVKLDGNGKLPSNVINRIKDDKLQYLMKNPGAPLNDSTVFVVKPKPESKLKGFDWSKTGVVNEKVAGTDVEAKNGFGSPAFYREVDENGFSTEVNFPGSAKFKMAENKPPKAIPVKLDDGSVFNVNLMNIETSEN